MASKTISVDLEAYERLRAARVQRDESFSKVIKRAQWKRADSTSRSLLAALESAPLPSLRVLARLEELQSEDSPPRGAWTA